MAENDFRQIDPELDNGSPSILVSTSVPPTAVFTYPKSSFGRHRRKKPRASLLWGISGGGILSALGFLGLTLYQQYNDSINELQRDLKHFNTTCTELIRKDEFHNRMSPMWGQIKKLEKELVGKSERLILVEHQLKMSEEDRKEQVRELQRLRERLASLEGKQSLAPSHREQRPTDY